MNSVTNIANIIKQTGLQSDEVNIIVAFNEENNLLVKKLGGDFGIGRIPLKGEQHKKFTFCTSTAFAGCDFYSTCASTFVISDNKKAYTSIDIATELAQIAGRQRLECNPFRNTTTFIYNVDVGENKDDSYKSALEKKLQDSNEYAQLKNSLTGKNREFAIKEIQTCQKLNKYSEHYVCYNEATYCFFVNNMAYLNECFSYDVQKENYLDGITVRKQLEDSGFNVSGNEVHLDYEEQLECIIKKEGFASLGYERIKALGYKELNLKNEMMNRRETYHLYKEFRAIFPVGTRMLTDMIKQKMEEVYAKYGIRQKGVASHLEKRFGIRIKPVKIPLADGSRKGGYEFI